MLKAVIFDFDGVIIDSEREKYLILNKIIKEHGYPSLSLPFSAFIGKKSAQILREEYPQMDANLIEKIVKTRRDIPHQPPLIKGIQKAIDLLREKGVKLGIATGNEYQNVQSILKHNNLDVYFDKILTSQRSKPDPDVYFKSLRELGVLSEESLVIEDSQAGIDAAKAAGCRVFALNTYGMELRKADAIFPDFTAMIPELARL